MVGPMAPFVYFGRLFYNDGAEGWMLGFVDQVDRPEGERETTSPSIPFQEVAILTFDCLENGCEAAGKSWRSPRLEG
jgi:hypothetical protein